MIYNIITCSVANKYRWTTLKLILLNDREVGPNHTFFIFAADLRSVRGALSTETRTVIYTIIASSFVYIRKYYLCARSPASRISKCHKQTRPQIAEHDSLNSSNRRNTLCNNE